MSRFIQQLVSTSFKALLVFAMVASVVLTAPGSASAQDDPPPDSTYRAWMCDQEGEMLRGYSNPCQVTVEICNNSGAAANFTIDETLSDPLHFHSDVNSGTSASLDDQNISFTVNVPTGCHQYRYNTYAPLYTNNSGDPETFDEQGACGAVVASSSSATLVPRFNYSQHCVEAEDFSVHKETYVGPSPRTGAYVYNDHKVDYQTNSASDGFFWNQDDIIWFALEIEAGEFRDLEDVIIQDLLPDGVCPLGVVNYENPTQIDTECEPVAGAGFGGFPNVPGYVDSTNIQPYWRWETSVASTITNTVYPAPYSEVTENADGTWLVEWNSDGCPAPGAGGTIDPIPAPTLACLNPKLAEIDADDELYLYFPVVVRDFYQENFVDDVPVQMGEFLDNPVGDSSTRSENFDIVTGTSTTADLAPSNGQDTDTRPPFDVYDGSFVRIASRTGIDIIKEVASPDADGTCPGFSSAAWNDANNAGAAAGDYTLGSQACYRITVPFNADYWHANVTVDDVLPAGLTFNSLDTSITPFGTTAGNTLPDGSTADASEFDSFVGAPGASAISWVLGKPNPGTGAAGDLFVTGGPDETGVGPDPDTTDNCDGANAGPVDSQIGGAALCPNGWTFQVQYLVDIDPTMAAPVTKENTATVNVDGVPSVSDDANIDIVEPPSELSTTKTVSTTPTENPDGTWSFTYTISVANTGAQDLTDLQVTDNLIPTFPAPVTFVVDSVTSPDFAENAGFDGVGDTNLLMGTDTIAEGAFGIILLEVTIDPNGEYGPYENEAISSGEKTQGSGTVSDPSQDLAPIDADGDGIPDDTDGDGIPDHIDPDVDGDGTPEDADGDGIPDVFEGDVDEDGNTGNDDDEPTLLPIPEIGLYKDITAGPTYDADGFYDLTYTLTVQNVGSTPLQNVQVTDSLATTFATPAAVNWSMESALVTSGPCTAASTTPFDGDANIALLEGADTLPVGGDCTIDIAVKVEPGTNLGTYFNVADTTASDALGNPVDDSSQDQSTPIDADGDGVPDDTDGDGTPDHLDEDPDGDGDPTNNNTPTPVEFPEDPEITLTKAIQTPPVSNGDGTWTFDYTFEMENTGDVILRDVQMVDDLTATFGSVAFVVDNIASPDLTVDGTFDGSGNTNTLAGTDELEPGETGTIVVTVTITPAGNFGQFDNTAVVDGTSPSGTNVEDDSQDAPVVDADGDGVPDDTDGDGIADHEDNDPDGDGDPTNNSDPTPLNLPAIANTKTVTDVVNNNDGSYDVTYEIVAENVGNTTLDDVQVNDDMDITYAPASNWTFLSTSVLSGPCVSSATYDGATAGDIGLLAGTDTLVVGELCVIEVTVNVVPGAFLGDYDNTSTASGHVPDTIGPDGTPIPGESVEDDSNDTPVVDVDGDGVPDDTDGDGIPDHQQGTDPDGDGDPTNDDSPTPVNFGQVAEIHTTKAVTSGPINNGDGTFTFTYTFMIGNTGDVILHAVQLTDDLTATFGSVGFTVDSLTSADFAVNPAFDGVADINMLDGTASMPINTFGELEMTVTITPAGDYGPYDNQTRVSGVPPTGLDADGNVIDADGDGIPDTTVADLSDDRPVVDADGDGIPDDTDGDGQPDHEEIFDGDGDPTNNDEPTPISIPAIGLTKAITNVVNNADGTYVVTYEFVPTNVGTVPLSGLQVTDDFSVTFATALSWSIASINSADFATNAAFDGAGDINMLDGTDTLAVGDSGIITVEVNLEPGETLGPWENTADTSGQGPDRLLPDGTIEPGAIVTDTSEDEPPIDTDGDGIPDNQGPGDPDGDGDPTNNNDPTILDLAETPQISLTKGLVAGPDVQPDSSFNVTFELVAENTGSANLSQVQVLDDLDATFGAATYTVVSVAATAPGTANAAFDGSTDMGLLDPAASNLLVGESTTITVVVNFIPADAPEAYENTATTSGIAPSGAAVEDTSQDGADADPDGDGDPSNNSDPTPFDVPLVVPDIGLAKQLIAGPTDNGDGTYRLTYELVVSNIGIVDLANLRVEDDLAAQWTTVTFSVNSLSSDTLTVNSGYDGSSDIDMLAGTDQLAVGESGLITLVVDSTRPASGEFDNQAETIATNALGTSIVNDLSEDGGIVDPDGDGSASEQTPTPAQFPAPPLLPDLAFTGRTIFGTLLFATLLVMAGFIFLGVGRKEDEEAAA